MNEPVKTVRQTAVVVLLRGDKVLLLQRNNDAAWAPGLWHMPGGTVEPNETIEEAVVREAKEEIGIAISIDDLRFQGIAAYHQEKAPDVDVFFFSARRWTGEPRVMEPHKHQRVSWESIHACPENLTDHCKEILKRLDEAIYIRISDGVVERVMTTKASA